MTVQNNIAAAHRFLTNVITDGAFETLDDICSPHVHYVTPTAECFSRNEVRALIAGARAAFPDLRVEILETFAGDDLVVCVARVTGTQLAEFEGHAASGRSADVPNVIEFRFDDSGAIVNIEAVFDRDTYERQLGRKLEDALRPY